MPRDRSRDRDERFDIRTSPSPSQSATEQALAEKLTARQNARMAAGYCRTWSDPCQDGSLVPDVQIGDWARPWTSRATGPSAAPPGP